MKDIERGRHDAAEVLRLLGVKGAQHVTLIPQPESTIPWAALYGGKRVAVIQPTYDFLVEQGARTASA